ncbi:MAG: hypothetical protein FWE14_12945 [Lachnospiraceae bacterium]|nr:hypothetical protein [Lachnospiraceae bacterium]
MSELKATEYKKFEDIKHIRNDGSEYWFARELALVLDYTQWRNFTKVIDKAMIACNNSGHDVIFDFAEVSKIVEMPSKPRKNKTEQIGFAEVSKTKNIIDYELSRYACYLIVQNGDRAKKLSRSDKPTLPFKPTGRKSRIGSTNWTRIADGLSFAAT